MMKRRSASRSTNSHRNCSRKLRHTMTGFAVLAMGVALVAPGTSIAGEDSETAQVDCRAERLSASMIYVKKLFDAAANTLINPKFDEARFVQDVRNQFAGKWETAATEETCDFPWNTEIRVEDTLTDPNALSLSSLDDLMNWIELEVSEIALLIGAHLVPFTRESTRVGAALLKAAGRKGLYLLKAESQDARRPDPQRRAIADTKAEKRFTRRWEMAARAAYDKGENTVPVEVGAALPPDGVHYLRPEVGESIDTLVANISTVCVSPTPWSLSFRSQATVHR
jgi:hypothetical protein